MADRVAPKFNTNEVRRAGKDLRAWWRSIGALGPRIEFPNEQSWFIASNWRLSHAHPLLTARVILSQRARRVGGKTIITQRLKRMTSTLDKLVRYPSMTLDQMQDLGGCRAVVADIRKAAKLFQLYSGADDSADVLGFTQSPVDTYDYVKSPKSDGYRGFHVVTRYTARAKENSPWNGQRIEIQIRTPLQHAFATAVETVATFTRTPLKSGGGEADWKRFFALAGSSFALREETTLVPGTPSDPTELKSELSALVNSLNVRQRLQQWTTSLHNLPWKNVEGFKWLLLLLDVQKSTISVTGYAKAGEARTRLRTLESSDPQRRLDAVLVWVGSIRNLRRAYPNYFADTRAFLEALSISLG